MRQPLEVSLGIFAVEIIFAALADGIPSRLFRAPLRYQIFDANEEVKAALEKKLTTVSFDLTVKTWQVGELLKACVHHVRQRRKSATGRAMQGFYDMPNKRVIELLDSAWKYDDGDSFEDAGFDVSTFDFINLGDIGLAAESVDITAKPVGKDGDYVYPDEDIFVHEDDREPKQEMFLQPTLGYPGRHTPS